MIEKTIRNYLTGALSVPVFLELPEVPSQDYPTWPDAFVLIEKVGGRPTPLLSTASIALQSHSLTSLYGAASLDEEVRQAMDRFSELTNIGSCEIASNYNHTDIRTKRYRYQSVYDITYVE